MHKLRWFLKTEYFDCRVIHFQAALVLAWNRTRTPKMMTHTRPIASHNYLLLHLYLPNTHHSAHSSLTTTTTTPATTPSNNSVQCLLWASQISGILSFIFFRVDSALFKQLHASATLNLASRFWLQGPMRTYTSVAVVFRVVHEFLNSASLWWNRVKTHIEPTGSNSIQLDPTRPTSDGLRRFN